MSKRSSLQGLLIALILCVVSILIYNFFIKKKDDFLLDNPTDKGIKVTLNGKLYSLAPGQTLGVPVIYGKNLISSTDQNGALILKDTFFVVEKTDRGLINPTLSEYYTFRRYYGYVKNLDSIYKAHKIIIDAEEYIGEIKESNNLILQNFYLNVNQNYPKVINKIDTIGSRVKLFRKKQFLEFYKSTFK